MGTDLMDNFFDTIQIINKIHQRDPYCCISQGLVSDFEMCFNSDFGILCSFKSSVLLALRNIFHGY